MRDFRNYLPCPRIYGELLVFFAQIFWCGLGQEPVEGLSLCQELHDCLLSPAPLSEDPAGVKDAQEAAGSTSASRPEGLVAVGEKKHRLET